jgi:hypothetical protein
VGEPYRLACIEQKQAQQKLEALRMQNTFLVATALCLFAFLLARTTGPESTYTMT